MSDHGSSDSSPGCFIFAGILTIPIGVIGRLLLQNYVTAHYTKTAVIPANILANIHLAETALIIIPLLGVFILFPLGVYALIKGHIGGGH